MRKKIASLKNRNERPSSQDMRAELQRLQQENVALLQLKQMEIENLELKQRAAVNQGQPVSNSAAIEKKQSELAGLLEKQAELKRIMELEQNLRSQTTNAEKQAQAQTAAEEQAKVEKEAVEAAKAQAMREQEVAKVEAEEAQVKAEAEAALAQAEAAKAAAEQAKAAAEQAKAELLAEKEARAKKAEEEAEKTRAKVNAAAVEEAAALEASAQEAEMASSAVAVAVVDKPVELDDDAAEAAALEAAALEAAALAGAELEAAALMPPTPPEPPKAPSPTGATGMNPADTKAQRAAEAKARAAAAAAYMNGGDEATALMGIAAPEAAAPTPPAPPKPPTPPAPPKAPTPPVKVVPMVDDEASALAAGQAAETEAVQSAAKKQKEEEEAAALAAAEAKAAAAQKEADEIAAAAMAAEQAAAEAAKKAAMTQSEKQAAAKQYFAAQADIAAKAEAEAKTALEEKAKAIATAKARALDAAKAELVKLQVMNKVETESKIRAKMPPLPQATTAAQKAKVAADAIAQAQTATEMAAASEACSAAEKAALEAAVAIIKVIEVAEEKAIIARATQNDATEAKLAADIFSAADPEALKAIAAEGAQAKYALDQAAADKAKGDRAAAEKAAADRAASATAAAEKAAADKAIAKAQAEKAIAADALAKEAAAEEAAIAQAAAEEAARIQAEAEEAARIKKEKEEQEIAETKARAKAMEKAKARAKKNPKQAYKDLDKLIKSGEGNAEDWQAAKKQADETIGHLLHVVKNGTVPKTGDHWFVEPAMPEAGGEVTVYYNAAATNLAGVKQYGSITINSGCNNWEEPQKEVMQPVKGRFKVLGKPVKAVKGSWWQKATVDVPDDAFVMDFVFSDGGSEYDNNNRADYHVPIDGAEEQLDVQRYRQAVELYHDLVEERFVREKKAAIRKERRDKIRMKSKAAAAEVTRKQREHVLFVDPPQPLAGETVRVHYNPSNTCMKTAAEVYIVGGWNRWSHIENIGPIKMERSDPTQTHVVAEFQVPADAYKMDFVFASSPDGTGMFDNNNRLDYHVPIKGGKDIGGNKVGEKPMHIVSVSVEMAPIAKVGGLGDVVTGLGRAMKEEGHRVEVVVPKYDVINYEAIQDFKEITGFAWGSTYNRVFHGIVEGVDTYFIDPENGMFQVGMIYGTDYLEIPMTDAERFGFFSKAALEWMLQSNRQPDIIHCHDWQTAPVARSYWEDYHKFGLSNPRIVFTIHNLNYGAPLIKEAMTYSQVSTTVSRTYREEVSGHESIYENLDKFHGVVNGIDPDIWDPANDDFLPRYFDEHECNDGKAAARAALCAHSNIPNKTEAPMIGIVTRLTTQKGIHLIKHGIMRSLERGCQVVMLGSAPDPEVQQSFDQMFHELKQGYHDFMCFHLYYNEPLSHLIYAGADMILVPSMFEPCGLSQLIAMRYGTVPIVRRTGGLNDTVFDYDIDHGKAEWEGMKPNGFSFDGVDESSIDYALDRGIDLFYNRPGDFRELQRNCMTQDWSWNRPALEYIEVYHAARKPF